MGAELKVKRSTKVGQGNININAREAPLRITSNKEYKIITLKVTKRIIIL